jgi:N-formylglutamate amidohydrolase
MSLIDLDSAPPPVEALETRTPPAQLAPFIYASPHSGRHYAPEFLAASRLDPVALRRSEDSFVDEIFAAAPARGAPLLRALFPRVYLDPNREPYELDPAMFEDRLPDHVNTRSLRVAGGIGTIARVVTNGTEIYCRKLRFAEAERRIAAYYRPYHRALARLVAETRARFGCAVLVDCHSMPSVGGPLDADSGRGRVDIVLGDRFGTACAPVVVEVARTVLGKLGYRVALNTPYAGGFNTQKYGQPEAGVHALQIEINRALYMDEQRIERRPGMTRVRHHMTVLIEALGRIDPAALQPGW